MSVVLGNLVDLPAHGQLLDAAADTARNALKHTLYRSVQHHSAGALHHDKAAPEDVLGRLENLRHLTQGGDGPARGESPEQQAEIAMPSDMMPVKPLARLTLALRSSPDAERRRAPRFPHFMSCILTLDGEDHATETLDIGRTGTLVLRPVNCDVQPGIRGTIWFSSIGSIDVRVTGLNADSVNLVMSGKLNSVAEAAMNGLILRLRSENDYQAGQARMLAATAISAFEAALGSSRLTMEALLDRQYRPVAGTAPQQFTTMATSFYDSVLPDILGRFFDPKSGMIYAVLTDRNGYVPVHNQPYSQPQRPDDPAFNISRSRQRRIYDDVVTLRAARFARDVVVQTYLRDIGNGPDVFVKDIAAPIVIRGRRWGCAEIAYSLRGD